jgi:hypothetical protein
MSEDDNKAAAKLVLLTKSRNSGLATRTNTGLPAFDRAAFILLRGPDKGRLSG